MGKPWGELQYWTWVAILLNFPSLSQFWTIPDGSKTEIWDGSGGSSLPGASPRRHQATRHSPPNYLCCFCSDMLSLIPYLPVCSSSLWAKLQNPCCHCSTALRLEQGVCDKKTHSDNALGQRSIAWVPLGNMDIASLLEVFWSSMNMRRPVLLDFRAANGPCLCLPV